MGQIIIYSIASDNQSFIIAFVQMTKLFDHLWMSDKNNLSKPVHPTDESWSAGSQIREPISQNIFTNVIFSLDTNVNLIYNRIKSHESELASRGIRHECILHQEVFFTFVTLFIKYFHVRHFLPWKPPQSSLSMKRIRS